MFITELQLFPHQPTPPLALPFHNEQTISQEMLLFLPSKYIQNLVISYHFCYNSGLSHHNLSPRLVDNVSNNFLFSSLAHCYAFSKHNDHFKCRPNLVTSQLKIVQRFHISLSYKKQCAGSGLDIT